MACMKQKIFIGVILRSFTNIKILGLGRWDDENEGDSPTCQREMKGNSKVMPSDIYERL